jgi:hypothetical protein
LTCVKLNSGPPPTTTADGFDATPVTGARVPQALIISHPCHEVRRGAAALEVDWRCTRFEMPRTASTHQHARHNAVFEDNCYVAWRKTRRMSGLAISQTFAAAARRPLVSPNILSAYIYLQCFTTLCQGYCGPPGTAAYVSARRTSQIQQLARPLVAKDLKKATMSPFNLAELRDANSDGLPCYVLIPRHQDIENVRSRCQTP